MHPKVLGAEASRLARRLNGAGALAGWTLAGGTGLALQLGHRRSDDLDFFRAGDFDVDATLAGLGGIASVAVQSRTAGTIHALLGGVRVSFLSAEAPLLFPGTPYRGLVVADSRDIAVMEVVAIGGRGARKDFVDLYFYLRSGGSLEDVFAMLRKRFARVDFNEYHLLRSLAYFDDAETEPMPRMLRRVAWREIRKAIEGEVRRLS
jgi:hypothetical protein